MSNLIFSRLIVFVFLLTALTGCEVIGGIFKAGVWVGIIIVVAVIVLVFWLFKKLMD